MQFLFAAILFQLSYSVFAQSEAGRPAKTYSRSYTRTGVLLDTAVYLGQSQANANPAVLNEWRTDTSIYELKFGYISDAKLYFGGEYALRSDNQISVNSNSGTSGGLGMGYFADNGFNFRSFYVFNSSYGDYSNGSGLKLDFGYLLNATSNFFVGFTLSVRQSIYKSNQTIVAFDSWTRNETYPFLNLAFVFN